MSVAIGGVERQSETNENEPYVGPRALRANEEFFARDREQRELAALLLAERIVLLHAPSGAGKTSLIQAGLAPLLKTQKFHPTVAARVKTPPPEKRQVHNRYAYSIALDLLGDNYPAEALESRALDDVIAETAENAKGDLVLIIDQFEEILSIDPTDRETQTGFFKELGSALADAHIWMLISMREDYMGGLDRFLRYLPGHLRATYRLDFLDRAAAKVAIQRPADSFNVDFADDAASQLVGQLAKVQRPGHGWVDAPYVQPFQLQVVCKKLWDSALTDKDANFRTIDLDDVRKHASVPRALRSYYADVVSSVAEKTEVDEMAIRDWFETRLIADGQFRRQTLTGPISAHDKSSDVLHELQEKYLIRSDTRAEQTWWELSHDTLVKAVLKDNETWLGTRLEPWQRAARAWEEDHEVALLLQGLELYEALRASNQKSMTPVEQEFLKESLRVEQQRGLFSRMQWFLVRATLIAGLELIAIIVLIVLLLTR